MKPSEAARIPQLLAARQPRLVVEEATIEGVHMLVIVGNEVDTVIQYTRNGGAKMPQLCTYDENAEEAAHADELLAKQRASGRRNTTGEGVEWPRNWKLAAAKAAGKIWYSGSAPEPRSRDKSNFPVSVRCTIPCGRHVGLKPSVANRQEACKLLAGILKKSAELHRDKLNELKEGTRDLEKPDFVWLSLVESASSLGNSRGYEGLFPSGDRDRYYKEIKFEALFPLLPADRLRVLAETLSATAVRWPNQKAEKLAANLSKIARMGGPAEAKAKLLRQPARDAKIRFLKEFDGIGDKYARNIFMNVYHPEFLQCIAIDARIESISEELGLKFGSYEAEEQFYLEVAEKAGLTGWDVDRLIYEFKDEVLAELRKRASEHK